MQDRAQQLAIIQRMIDAGESEQNIATVIQHFKTQSPETAAPSDWRTNPQHPLAKLGKGVVDVVTNRENWPAMAATGAAMATGGASIPVQMAVTGGAAMLGQAAGDASEQMPPTDRFSNMALSGMKQALLQGAVGKAVQAAPKMQQLARNLWNRAAKVTEPVAKTTQTMRMGGTLDQAKDEIAETVLSQGRGTLRAPNVEKMRESLESLDTAIDQIVANSKGLIPRQELRDALTAQYKSIPVGTQASEAARQAIERTFVELNKQPVKMTVQKAQDLKRFIYRTYEKSFAADVTQTANAAADKTVARQLRTAIAREEPAVAPINAQLSRQIPATKAMEKAVSRTVNHNPVGLTQTLAGVVTNPGTVAAALINHPKIASFTAQQLYNAAKRLPTQARTAGNIIRMASMGLNGGPVASHETGRN